MSNYAGGVAFQTAFLSASQFECFPRLDAISQHTRALLEGVLCQFAKQVDVVIWSAWRWRSESRQNVSLLGRGIDLLELDAVITEKHVPTFAVTVCEIPAAGDDISGGRPGRTINIIHAED